MIARLEKLRPQTHRQWLAVILALGLGLRLLALPFAHTTEPDAVTRIWLGWEWLNTPHTGIQGAVWLPLHTYVLGIVFNIIKEFYYTPVLLNILFSVLTAIPLYWFSRQEFGEKAGATVATAFMLYPLAFRNSLMALSDTPFALLIAASLPFLSQARKQSGRWWSPALAGLFVTLAAAIRYEGWVLIPFMALVLWRYPKKLLLFGTAAMIFPSLWMAGCWIVHGNPLYSFNYQAVDTAATLVNRGGISLLKRFVRLIFFPGVLGFGLSLPVLGLACWGAATAVWHRKQQAIWLVPFFGLFLILSYKAVSGTMNLQPRYALPIGMLLLPFMALGLEHFQQRRSLMAIGSLALMLPFSYSPNVLRPVLGTLLSDTRMVKQENPARLLEAVPRLAPTTRQFSQQINQALRPETDGLVMLGYNDITYLITHATRLSLEQICTVEDYTLGDIIYRERCYQFFETYEEGVLAIYKPNWPTAMLSQPMGKVAWLGNGQKLALKTVAESEESVIYRFRVAPDR